MTLVSDGGESSLVSQLEALSARVEKARTGAEARAQAIVAERPPTHSAPTHSSTAPVDPRKPPVKAPERDRRRPSRPILILALVLVLLGAGITAIVVGSRGLDTQSPDSSVTDGTGAGDRRSPAVTAAQGTAPVSPAAPATVQEVPPPATASAPDVIVMPASPDSVRDAPTSVVIDEGDSFWTIAEHRVASARGDAPTITEVARYWVELVEANMGRLAHPGNPNVIYAGQTFALP